MNPDRMRGEGGREEGGRTAAIGVKVSIEVRSCRRMGAEMEPIELKESWAPGNV